MRQQSTTLRKTSKIFHDLGMNAEQAFHNTKLLLKIYRDVVWSLTDRADDIYDESYELGGGELDRALSLLADFAPEVDRKRFEEKISSMMNSRMMVEFIDKALVMLKEYPRRGELYFDILYKQYCIKYHYTEDEILDSLRMERSVFYDRKKEAITLFGITLWGYILPEYKDKIWRLQ